MLASTAKRNGLVALPGRGIGRPAAIGEPPRDLPETKPGGGDRHGRGLTDTGVGSGPAPLGRRNGAPPPPPESIMISRVSVDGRCHTDEGEW